MRQIRQKRKSPEQRKIESAAAWLCVEYLSTILPRPRHRQISELVINYFVTSKNPRKRQERLLTMFDNKVALLLEKTRDKDGFWKMNARIIGKFDPAPLKGICQDGSGIAEMIK